MSGERCSSQRNRLAVVHQAIDRMFFSPGTKLLRLGFVHAPNHDLGSGQFLNHRVALYVVRMRVTGDQNLGVAELESQLLNIGADHRNRRLVVAVHQDVALRRHDQERRLFLGPYVIEIVHDAMGRKRVHPSLRLRHRHHRIRRKLRIRNSSASETRQLLLFPVRDVRVQAVERLNAYPQPSRATAGRI